MMCKIVLSFDGTESLGMNTLNTFDVFSKKYHKRWDITSPKFNETLRDDFESSCWSSITFSFYSLFSILKLWIVNFKRSDEVFQICAFNLAGVDNIIDCLLEILLDSEIQEFSNFW